MLSVLLCFGLHGWVQDPDAAGQPAPRLEVGGRFEAEIRDTDPEVRTWELDRSIVQVPTLGRSFELDLEGPGTYSIELASLSFDAYLVLRDENGLVLAEDDDGGPGKQARIVIEIQEPASRRVEACALRGGRGAFELRVVAGGLASPTRDEELAELRRALEFRERGFGPDDPRTARSIHQIGVHFLAQGDAAAARSWFERALALRETKLGPDHLDTAESLNDLALARRVQGDLVEARALIERALAIYRRQLPEEHASISACRMNLGLLLQDLGDLAGARSCVEGVLAIRERVCGHDHPRTAESLVALAMLLQVQGEYPAAKSHYERGIALRRAVLGPQHPDTVNALGSLGGLLVLLGEHAQARTLLEQALADTEEALGPDAVDVATCLGNLGLVLTEQGELESARALLERGLAIAERKLPPDAPSMVLHLNGLAHVLRAQGELAAARGYLERALAISERRFGPGHPSLAIALNNLGFVVEKLGDLPAARSYYERALAIQVERSGAESPAVATMLSNLGLLLLRLGDDAAANTCLERALEIREAKLGSDHPQTAQSLNNLGLVYLARGELAEAQAWFQSGLEIRERRLGPTSLEVAQSLNNLAHALALAGELGAALPHLERAVAIQEAHPESADLAGTLNNLAMLLQRQARPELAREQLERACAACTRSLGPGHPDTAKCLLNLAVLLIDQGNDERAWEVLRPNWDPMRASQQALLTSLSEAECYAYLATIRLQLDALLSLAAAREGMDEEAHELVLSWKGQVSRRLLQSRSKLAAGSSVTQDEVSADALSAVLPAGSVLLDFFLHHAYEPGSRAGVAPYVGRWTEPRLSVWIVKREQPRPVWLDLGPAAVIEGAVQAFLARVCGAAATAGARGIGVGGQRAAEDPGAELRSLLWAPLAGHLEGVETVFVSPDGFLGALPVEVLQVEEGAFLIERYSFVYVQDPATLLRAEERGSPSDSLLALGGVDYDASEPEGATDEAGLADLGTPREATTGSRGGLGRSWPELAFTGVEAEGIAQLHALTFPAGRRLLLERKSATEERLQQELGKHAVVHLATHGFFDPQGVSSLWRSALDASRRPDLAPSAEPPALSGESSGLLTGLVCAGANAEPRPGCDDGFLTAAEVGSLDLSGVELLVLSACETALGRAQAGEGLLGLRRAFELAGARTVISSSWSVEDDSTASLMRTFYENLWQWKLGRKAALRAAQLQMLEANRSQRGAPLPSTWGAFVLSGEWR